MLNYSRSTTQKISSITKNFAKIFISEKAYMQMSYIIKNSDIEVGWLSTVSREGNNFIIEECYLIEQEAHSTTCELKEEALNNFALNLIQNNEIETYEKLKCWCHSHVNMGVSPSGQDNNQMNLFKDNDYFIRGIGNKKGEMKFDIFDFQNNLLIEDVCWEIKRDENITNRIKLLKEELERLTTIQDASLELSIKEELKEKVKKISYWDSFTNKSKHSPYISSSYSTSNYDYTKPCTSFSMSTGYEKSKKSNSKKSNSKKSKYEYKYNDYDDYSYYPYGDDIFSYYDDEFVETSVFDNFTEDELIEKYESFDYDYKKMSGWIKSQFKSLTEYELENYMEELDVCCSVRESLQKSTIK